MLDKQNRITRKKDIERILKKGKSFKEDFLILKTKKNDLNTFRFGFIVSQKVSKKAVVRNKIKRRLREAIKLMAKQLEPGNDNLLIVLPGEAEKKFQDIQKTIEKLLKRAKIWPEN